MPYSFLGYNLFLGLVYIISRVFTNFRVPDNLVLFHNIFLSLQSLLLMFIAAYLYYSSYQETPNIWDALLFNHRLTYLHINYFLNCFLLSKLYEAVDTAILIINRKTIIPLHWWHHATIFIAFSTGIYSYAFLWIGFLNSFIHVIMYLYYAYPRHPVMKKLAIYITSLQMFHLCGGGMLNIYTMFRSEIINADSFTTTLYSGINGFLCFSYLVMFIAFFGKKYQKKTDVPKSE